MLAKARPGILGALLDAASAALANHADVNARLEGRLPRMADFAIWVEAAAPAIGWRAGRVLDRLHQDAGAKPP